MEGYKLKAEKKPTQLSQPNGQVTVTVPPPGFEAYDYGGKIKRTRTQSKQET